MSLLRETYTQDELFKKGTDKYSKHLNTRIQIALKNFENEDNILLNINFEEKLEIEIKGHIVKLPIGFLHYGPHTKENHHFRSRLLGKKLAFNSAKNGQLLQKFNLSLVDLSDDKTARICITSNPDTIAEAKTKWHHYLFFPESTNKISSFPKALPMKSLNSKPHPECLETISENSHDEASVCSSSGSSQNSEYLKSSNSTNLLIEEVIKIMKSASNGSFYPFKSSSNDGDYEEALNCCVQNEMILVRLENDQYELYFPFEGCDFSDRIPVDIWDLFRTFNSEENEDDYPEIDEKFDEEYDEQFLLETFLLNSGSHLPEIEIDLSGDNFKILINGFLFETLDFVQWQYILGQNYFNINGYFLTIGNISINNSDVKYKKNLIFDETGNYFIDKEVKETTKVPIQNFVDYFQFTYCNGNTFILVNGECWNDVSIQGNFDF